MTRKRALHVGASAVATAIVAVVLSAAGLWAMSAYAHSHRGPMYCQVQMAPPDTGWTMLPPGQHAPGEKCFPLHGD